MKKMFGAVVLFVVTSLFAVGCNKVGGGDVALVKNGYLPFDNSITIGQALDGYKFFKSKEWSAYKTEQGRRIVELKIVGDIDKVTEANNELKKTSPVSAKIPAAVSGSIKFVINGDNSIQLAEYKMKVNYPDGEERNVTYLDTIKQLYRNQIFAMLPGGM